MIHSEKKQQVTEPWIRLDRLNLAHSGSKVVALRHVNLDIPVNLPDDVADSNWDVFHISSLHIRAVGRCWLGVLVDGPPPK